jgi:serine/threonine-protein kinase
MFHREAQAASRVNHPNVVNIFDVVDHDGMACIVMELLDGEPLARYFARKGLLSVEEAAALLLPAMRGVAAANAQGVVHRDLKPHNIFICIGPDGRLLTTKVLDFGISVVVEKAIGGGNAETLVVARHGTPAYMSPEHITAAPDIDERADVYGFGVLFFEALTGHVPFVGEPSQELLMRILNEPAPKVSVFRPDVRPVIVTMIDRALAKNPNHRFPTLNAFIAALEEHFLPASPLARALTPMAGVPLFDQPTGRSGVADAVVQVVRRPEGSAEHPLYETQSLFGLSPDRRLSDGESSRRVVSLSQGVEFPPTEAVSLGASLLRPRGRIRRVLAAGAAFVGAILLVGWLAMPRRPSKEASVPPAPLPIADRAAVLPAVRPASPSPKAPEPTLPSAVPTLASEPIVAEPLAARPAPRPQRVGKPAPRLPGRAPASVGPSRDKPEAPEVLSVPLEPPPLPSTEVPSTRPSPTRAGRLSPSDF